MNQAKAFVTGERLKRRKKQKDRFEKKRERRNIERKRERERNICQKNKVDIDRDKDILND